MTWKLQWPEVSGRDINVTLWSLSSSNLTFNIEMLIVHSLDGTEWRSTPTRYYLLSGPVWRSCGGFCEALHTSLQVSFIDLKKENDVKQAVFYRLISNVEINIQVSYLLRECLMYTAFTDKRSKCCIFFHRFRCGCAQRAHYKYSAKLRQKLW